MPGPKNTIQTATRVAQAFIGHARQTVQTPNKTQIHQFRQYATKNTKGPILPNHINSDCKYNQEFIKAEFHSPYPHVATAEVRLPFADLEAPFADFDTPNFQNSAGAIHGGVQFGIHDLAACHALSHLDLEGATKTGSISYVSPAYAKEIFHLQATATVRSVQGNSAHVTSELHANRKQLVSMAQFVFSVRKPKVEAHAVQPSDLKIESAV